MRRHDRNEAGFTLIELIVTIAILGIIVGSLSAAIVVGLRTTDETTDRLSDSHDLQLLSVYLPADAQSAVEGRIDTDGGTATACTTTDPAGSSNVLQLLWDQPGGTRTFTAAYREEDASGETVLARYSCVDGGTATRIVVAHGLGAGTTAAFGSRSITMQLVLASGLTTSITANRRTPGAVPPDLVVTFPVNGGEYNDTGWNGGCATDGMCGTASDSVGVQAVEVSLLRVSTGTYWNGTAFASGSAVYNAASGTTTWTYGFPASSFPAEGSYAATVRVTNTLGTQTSSTVTFVIDRSAPATSDNTATLGSSWKNTDQTVTLAPTDSGGAGVSATYYTTNGTTPTTASSTGTSIALTSEGSFTVKYFSTDGAGNQEAVRTAATAIRIDKTPPSSATLSGAPTHLNNGDTLTGSATDALSGIATLEFLYCAGTTCTPSISLGTATGSPGSVTWNSQPADGAYRVLVRAIDNAGNVTDSSAQSVTIDNTVPTIDATALTLTNGGTAGRVDRGDTVVIGFSEALKASSLCSTWTSDSTAQTLNGDSQVVVTITDNGASDVLSLSVSGACGNAFRFGTLALSADYVSATTTFSGSGNPAATRSALTWNPTAKTLTVTLGKPSATGNLRSGVTAAAITYTPLSGLTDVAGNALATTAVGSSGAQQL